MDNNNYTQPDNNGQNEQNTSQSQQYTGEYTSAQYTAEQNYSQNQQPFGSVQPQETGAGTMAIVSLIMGILSIVTCCVGIGLIFGIVAIILAGISLSKKRGKGVSIGGLVTGIIGTLLSLVIVIYIIMAGVAFGTMKDDPEFQKEFNEIMESMDEA